MAPGQVVPDQLVKFFVVQQLVDLGQHRIHRARQFQNVCKQLVTFVSIL
jgi:hypothetical protein